MRCLYRRPGAPASLDGLDVELARGDVRDAAAVRAAVEGVDTVFHLAALTRSLTRRQMLRTNTEGTQALLEAALDAELPGHFVLCSSLAAVGPAPLDAPHDEAVTRRPISWYGESKVLAEDLVLAASDRLKVTVVRPPAVYGPRDRDFLTVFRSIQGGLVPVVGEPGWQLSLVHAADLATALAAAGQAPAAAGRTYFACHPEIVTQEGLLAAVETALDGRARRLRLPPSLLRLVGRVTDTVTQITGRPSILGSQRVVELASANWICSPAALMQDTGWEPQMDLLRGLRDTAAWYRAEGQL